MLCLIAQLSPPSTPPHRRTTFSLPALGCTPRYLLTDYFYIDHTDIWMMYYERTLPPALNKPHKEKPLVCCANKQKLWLAGAVSACGMGTCTLLLTHRCSHGSTDRQTAVSSAAGLVGSFGGANELLYLTSYIKGNDLKINKQQTALRHKPEACSVLVFPGLGLVTRAHKTAQCKTPYKQKQLKASWPSSQN